MFNPALDLRKLHKTIVSSYKLYEYCKARYPKRKVIPHYQMMNDTFYYWTKDGTLRIVKNKKEIWSINGTWIR